MPPSPTQAFASTDRIFFAIATYNRWDLTRISSRSLAQVKHLDQMNVYVFDDRSTDYRKEDLEQLYSFARAITIRPLKTGADGNMMQIFKDFLASPAQEEVLFLGDSDLLYHEDFYPKFQEFWPKTKGVLSFFRSVLHTEIHAKTPTPEGLVEKTFLPALGTFIHRKLVVWLFSLPLGTFNGKFFDWYWSGFFRRLRIPLYVTEQGFVQHLGIASGQNRINVINKIPVSLNFMPSNPEDLQSLFVIWDHVLQRIPQIYRPKNMLKLPYWITRHYVRYFQIRFCLFWHFFIHQGKLRKLRKKVEQEIN